MYIKIRVNAGAKKEEIIEKTKTHFEISVREKPERNAANKKIRELIALRFKLLIHKVRIVSGHHSHSKILSVDTE